MSTLRANTLKPITSGNSLVLQGDSGGSGVSGPSIDSNGDVDFSQNTDAKVKLPSGGGIYESDGSTEILTESSGAVSLKNTILDSSNTFPSGYIIQVVQTVKSDTFSSAINASFTAVTGLSQAITLSNSSNKVLVLAQLSAVNEQTGGGVVGSIFRGSTNILIADTGSSNQLEGAIAFEQYNNDMNMPPVTSFMQKLDSPGSTGPHTYQVKIAGDVGGNTIYVNRTESDLNQTYIQRTTSVITLMEVVG